MSPRIVRNPASKIQDRAYRLIGPAIGLSAFHFGGHLTLQITYSTLALYYAS